MLDFQKGTESSIQASGNTEGSRFAGLAECVNLVPSRLQ